VCRKEVLNKPMGQSPQSCGRLSLVGLAQLFLSSCCSCGLFVRRLPPLAPILNQCPLNEERATKVLGPSSLEKTHGNDPNAIVAVTLIESYFHLGSLPSCFLVRFPLTFTYQGCPAFFVLLSSCFSSNSMSTLPAKSPVRKLRKQST
jgi:hypothetical protein